jgi:hypothetical protein
VGVLPQGSAAENVGTWSRTTSFLFDSAHRNFQQGNYGTAAVRALEGVGASLAVVVSVGTYPVQAGVERRPATGTDYMTLGTPMAIVSAETQAATQLAGEETAVLAPALEAEAASSPAVTGKGSPAHLTAGKADEVETLQALGKASNKAVERPTASDVQTPLFKATVGEPKMTPGGQFRGTIFDSKQGGNLEIKTGSSPLSLTYQIRLQTYLSVRDDTAFTIATSRPLTEALAKFADTYAIKVEPVK